MLALVIAGILAAPAGTAAAPRTGMVEIPVTAQHRVERRISPRLVLRVERDLYVSGAIAGWDVEVEDTLRPSDGNLLHHSRIWHGPHPSQVSAWIIRDHFYPSANTLDVRGYPWSVRIECRDCVTAGEGPDAYFVSGTIRVRWRTR